MEYILIDIGLAVGTWLLGRLFHVRLFRTWRDAVLVLGIAFLVGVAWDTYGIFRHNWTYPSGHTLGIYIGLMPLEDYAFMLVVPYFVIMVYAIVAQRMSQKDAAV